jgi:[citrate (pro-3S)-lyase] ligase
MELDVSLFATRIAPFFNIKQRFVGTEPNCLLTQRYNLTMSKMLPLYGIELIEIERQQMAQETISASHVRQLLATGDLEQLHNFVPDSTLAFLRSKDGELVRKKLENESKTISKTN